MTYKFPGFSEGKTKFSPIPAQFFVEILPNLNHLGELRLLLHIFWMLDRMEGSIRYLYREELVDGEFFPESQVGRQNNTTDLLGESLELLLSHNILLEAKLESDVQENSLLFLNTPRGRAAIDSISRGHWQIGEDRRGLQSSIEINPNIYQLYEENIGPLTPLIADALADAEDSYPEQWINDAFRIAVEKNNHNWHYIAAILDRWQKKGRYERQDRRDSEEARRRYADWEK